MTIINDEYFPCQSRQVEDENYEYFLMEESEKYHEQE